MPASIPVTVQREHTKIHEKPSILGKFSIFPILAIHIVRAFSRHANFDHVIFFWFSKRVQVSSRVYGGKGAFSQDQSVVSNHPLTNFEDTRLSQMVEVGIHLKIFSFFFLPARSM